MSDYLYDVALSFAGEDRDYVKQVADQLRTNGVRVFYDEYERANLWGKELIGFLECVYKDKSKFVVIFVSKSYLINKWANHELQSALNRAFENKGDYILPIRLDDTKLPGLHESIGYLPAKNLPPVDICEIFLNKIGLKNISTIQSNLFLYRITRKMYAEFLHPLPGKGSTWISIGNAVFYSASNIALATLEFLSTGGNRSSYYEDFVTIQYTIPSNVPITIIYESELPDGWNKLHDWKETQELGNKWLRAKDSCILSVPSSVVRQERNYLLNPNHTRFQELKINRIDEFKFDPRLFTDRL